MNTCSDCNADISNSWWPWWKTSEPCSADSCSNRLCSKCASKHPLIPYDETNEHSNDLHINNKVKCYCKSCFERISTLDFSRTSDRIVPPSGVNPSGMTFVFAHGAGGSRQMFFGHATLLAEKYGHTCILFDLPGHATKLDVPLTLESAATTLKDVLDEHKIITGEKTVYVGGSLGAYIGFYLLKEFSSHFSSAILLDCGQNVGPGKSFKAAAGLWFLSSLGAYLSNKAILGAMLNEVKKSKADYKLVETCFGSGMYFEQTEAHVNCLRAVAPAEYLPELPFPILFMNGSEDYRDSEDKWLALCKMREQSELKVYQGGDHFFTHDTRFLHDMLERWDAFSRK